jgi:hypothetical protein
MQRRRELDGLEAVRGLGHHLDAVALGQQHPDEQSYVGRVVDQQHA